MCKFCIIILNYSDLEKLIGRPVYMRFEAEANASQKKILKNLTPDMVTANELAGEKILGRLTRDPENNAPIGGLEVVTENGWFAARPSGTEDIYKIYAESFLGEAHVLQIQEEAQVIVQDAFMAAGVL